MDAEDTRTKEQRYHDGLQEAMRRLIASGLLPERAGQPVKIWAHVTLAELRALDDGSVLQDQWITEMAVRWAARRAEISDGSGGDGGAWLTGKAAEAMACDAIITPVVTGDIDPGMLDDLVRLCVELDRLDHAADHPAPPADGQADGSPSPPRPGRRCGRRSSARPWTSYPVPAGWPASCAPSNSARGWSARACPWTSGSARRSRPASATRSSCGTAAAAGPAAATSPRRPVKSTTSST